MGAKGLLDRLQSFELLKTHQNTLLDILYLHSTLDYLFDSTFNSSTNEISVTPISNHTHYSSYKKFQFYKIR